VTPFQPYQYRFILGGADGRTVVPCDDILQWGAWIDTRQPVEGIVAQEEVADCWVSTVFVGIDASAVVEDRPPEPFETLVTGDSEWKYRRTWATWAEAEAGHRAIVAKLLAGERLGGHEP
jgi:hypothetical protein